MEKVRPWCGQPSDREQQNRCPEACSAWKMLLRPSICSSLLIPHRPRVDRVS